MLIKEIQTGRTIGSKRRANLVVDGKVYKPGQLAELTDFLTHKGLIATPGYDEGHILRVRGFSTDSELRDLLTQEFPKWLKGRSHALGDDKLVDEKVAFLPLDRADHQPFGFKRFVHKYSTPLVGALSVFSAGALLHDSLSGLKAAKPLSDMAANLSRSEGLGNILKTKSGITAIAAGFFMSASALLTGLGTYAARKPSVSEMIKGMEPKLNQDPERFDPAKEVGIFQSLKSLAINNPWKFATAFNLFGVIINTIGHGIPSYKTIRDSKTKLPVQVYGPANIELIGSAASLVSLGLIGTAAKEKSNSLLGIDSYENSIQASDPLEKRYHAGSLLIPFSPSNDKGKAGHLNMEAAGWLSMVSNSAFGLKGVFGVMGGMRHKDALAKQELSKWPLTLLIPLNIAADYLTTLSKPSFSYSIDEMATEAADYIAHKLDVKKTDPETVTRQTFMLSELLASNPRVTFSSRQLREAIAGRLVVDYGLKMPSQNEGQKEYEYLASISPFLKQKEILPKEKMAEDIPVPAKEVEEHPLIKQHEKNTQSPIPAKPGETVPQKPVEKINSVGEKIEHTLDDKPKSIISRDSVQHSSLQKTNNSIVF